MEGHVGGVVGRTPSRTPGKSVRTTVGNVYSAAASILPHGPVYQKGATRVSTTECYGEEDS